VAREAFPGLRREVTRPSRPHIAVICDGPPAAARTSGLA
jgi:hypothetical protein